MLLRPPSLSPIPTPPGGGGGGEGVDLGTYLRLSDSRTVSEIYTDPAFLVNLIVRNLFVAAGIVLFLLIIYAGFKFIGGGAKSVEEARTIATTAIIGFIIMFSAYWIVRIVALITGAEIVL
jgi:hypothetical protein